MFVRPCSMTSWLDHLVLVLSLKQSFDGFLLAADSCTPTNHVATHHVPVIIGDEVY